MNLTDYGIKKFICGFYYMQVGFYDGDFERSGSEVTLQINEMPRNFMRDFEEQLWKAAGWNSGDNKAVFLFEGTDQMLHAISCYDFTIRHLKWGKGWGDRIPANFHRGQEKVKEALKRAGY